MERGYEVCDGQSRTRDSVQMYISELVVSVFGIAYSKALMLYGP